MAFFATSLVAEAMKRYPQIRFHRIIFCGSIVPRDFDWDAAHAQGQFERALNDYGRNDIWARIAEWVMSDASSSGYGGFDHLAGGAVVQRQNQFWGHSSYFKLLNFRDRWLPFLVLGRDPNDSVRFREKPFNRKFVVACGVLVVLIAASAWLLLR